MVSFIYGSGEPNPHFHEIVSPKLNLAELVTELREFGLPTDGLKADLQARLQLAYLGVLDPEHEEEIAGWFGLNKAGLDKKCKELGVVGGPAKASMQVNRRAAVMKFLGIDSAGVSTTLSFGAPSTSTSILPPAQVSTTPAPLATPAAVVAPESTASKTVSIPAALMQEIRRLGDIQQAPTPSFSFTESPSAALAPAPAPGPSSAPAAPAPANAPALVPGPSSSPSLLPSASPLSPSQSPSPTRAPSTTPIILQVETISQPTIKDEEVSQTSISTSTTPPPSYSSGIICILSDTLYQAQGPVMSRLGDSDQTYLDALTRHFHDKFMARLVTVRNRY